MHERWHLTGKALITPRFYAAFIVSFGIAYLLMYLVEIISKKLDRICLLGHDKLLRLILQFLLRSLLQVISGVVLLAALDLGLMFLYFKAIGIEFPLTEYLIRDFPIVVVFLVLLNGYYVWTWVRRSKKKKITEKVPEVLTISYNGTHLKLTVTTDILFFCRDRKLIKVYTTSGKEYTIKGTIVQINDKYKAVDFFQINPSTVLNLQMIQGYIAGTSRDTLQVIFKKEHQEAIHMTDNQKLLRVTKDHIEKFKSELEHIGS